MIGACTQAPTPNEHEKPDTGQSTDRVLARAAGGPGAHRGSRARAAAVARDLCAWSIRCGRAARLVAHGDGTRAHRLRHRGSSMAAKPLAAGARRTAASLPATRDRRPGLHALWPW